MLSQLSALITPDPVLSTLQVLVSFQGPSSPKERALAFCLLPDKETEAQRACVIHPRSRHSQYWNPDCRGEWHPQNQTQGWLRWLSKQQEGHSFPCLSPLRWLVSLPEALPSWGSLVHTTQCLRIPPTPSGDSACLTSLLSPRACARRSLLLFHRREGTGQRPMGPHGHAGRTGLIQAHVLHSARMQADATRLACLSVLV